MENKLFSVPAYLYANCISMYPFASFTFIFLIYSTLSFSQIISGPMLGPIELRDAKVWVEVAPQVKSVKLVYSKKAAPAALKIITYKGGLGKEFNPIQFTLGELDLNTTYQYRLVIDGREVKESTGEFTTKDLWQWRKQAPDFSFITGSCAYFNQPQFDRPGKPYGRDSSIFEAMAKEKTAFMLWTGDNWYTREVDYYSTRGLWYRAHHDRTSPALKNFLKAMSHYASWDDHDYGPNNSGAAYILKEESRTIFMNYWCNPSYGEGGEGIYTMLSYSDVDIFLCDDRWWRSADNMKDSIDGFPNPQKTMLGAKQMTWLKNALLTSGATFKIIVIGSQVLNPVSPYDKWKDFSVEYNELINFLRLYKLNGILFLSGDRHHTEVIKVDRPGTYPLYDITVSPLTSGGGPFSGAEKENPYRVLGITEKQNYGRFSISGQKDQRTLRVEFLGVKGEKLGEWSVSQTGLKTPE